jgi:4-hydroxythreonine-4-phosphate dehydrogenase
MLKALGVPTALSIPSIPGAGRTTVGGVQYYHGKPIKETIHGEDRFNPNPVWTSSNIELLSRIQGLKIESIPLDEVRSGSLEILSRVNGEGKKVLLFDSETDEDIDRIVGASMDLDPSLFFYVGSFGLSKSLGRCLSESFPGVRNRLFPPSVRTASQNAGKVLIVSGSSHPMARAQMARAEKMEKIKVLRVAPEDLLERLPELIPETIRTLHAAVHDLERVGIVIGDGKTGIEKQSREIAIALGELVGVLLEAYPWKALVLIGGDTGYAVSRSVGIRRIEIAGNISFVAAYGKPIGPKKSLDVLVTKGGSLGDENTLAEILTFIDHP